MRFLKNVSTPILFADRVFFERWSCKLNCASGRCRWWLWWPHGSNATHRPRDTLQNSHCCCFLQVPMHVSLLLHFPRLNCRAAYKLWF